MTEILITATTRDLRWARICLASVRHFHPECNVRILPGAPLHKRFIEEVNKHWNTGIYPAESEDYGWGLVKLEPLFRESGHRFLILDADTILTGPVLDLFDSSSASFLVDAEQQSEEDQKRLYYDLEKVRNVDPEARSPAFLFNSGQWFGTSGIIDRADFNPWVEWSFPRRLHHPEIFMPGDQGVLNYVLNQKHLIEGVQVDRKPLMRWPGNDELADFTTRNLDVNPNGSIIHWAGLKSSKLESLPRSDILMYFEDFYYSRIPNGNSLKRTRARFTQWTYQMRRVRTKLSQRLKRRTLIL